MITTEDRDGQDQEDPTAPGAGGDGPGSDAGANLRACGDSDPGSGGGHDIGDVPEGESKAPNEVRPASTKPVAELTDDEIRAAPRAGGGAGVLYQCPTCGAQGCVPDSGAAKAWLQGVPITANCHACQGVLVVPNVAFERAMAKQAKSRIVTPGAQAPLDPMERKVIDFMNRESPR